MTDPKVFELAKFVKEYIEKRGYGSAWEKYKSDISFPDKMNGTVFFFSPIEKIKAELEEFDRLIKEAEAAYRSGNRV